MKEENMFTFFKNQKGVSEIKQINEPFLVIRFKEHQIGGIGAVWMHKRIEDKLQTFFVSESTIEDTLQQRCILSDAIYWYIYEYLKIKE